MDRETLKTDAREKILGCVISTSREAREAGLSKTDYIVAMTEALTLGLGSIIEFDLEDRGPRPIPGDAGNRFRAALIRASRDFKEAMRQSDAAEGN